MPQYKTRKVVESFQGVNPASLKLKNPSGTILPLLRLDCGHVIVDGRELNYMNERANQVSKAAEAFGAARKARCHYCGVV